MKNKTIKIVIEGGCVVDVANLPRGYSYEVVDHDALEDEQREWL